MSYEPTICGPIAFECLDGETGYLVASSLPLVKFCYLGKGLGGETSLGNHPVSG